MPAPVSAPTPMLDAAQEEGVGEESSEEGMEEGVAVEPGSDQANAAPAEPGDGEPPEDGGAPAEGNAELDADVDGDADEGGDGGGETDQVDASMSEEGGEETEGEGEGEAGEVAVAGGGGGGGGGGDVVSTPMSPLAPAATPSAGGLANMSIGGADVDEDEDQAILDNTGLSADAHVAAAQGQLDQLAGQIEINQNEVISYADALSVQVQGALSALAGEVQAGIASASGGVSGAYSTAKSAVAGAAATAHAAVDGAASTAIANLDASLASNITTLSEQCLAAAEQIRGLETTWAQPFADLEQRYAGSFSDAAVSAADSILANKSTIASAFAGSGTAIERAKGERKVKAAEKLVENGATRIRGEGPAKAAEAITELNHGQIIQGFVAPLAARLGTYEQEATAALNAAAQQARDTIIAGKDDAHAHIDADLASADGDFDADKQSATDEIDVSGEQLESDLDTHIGDTEALFLETAASQADGYRAFSEGVSEGMADLPFMSEGQAEEFVINQEQQLLAFHDGNIAALDTLAAETEANISEEMRAGVQNLTDLKGQNDIEVQALSTEKVAAMQGISSNFQLSLDSTATAVSDEMANWTNPFGGDAQAYIQSAQAEVTARAAASDSALGGKLSQYQGQLTEQVSNFAANIDPSGAADDLVKQLRDIVKDSKSAMRGLGTDENKLFNALRKVDSATVGAAVHEQWARQNPGSSSLNAWLKDDLDDGEMAIANAYLSGNRAEGARLELEDNMNWYGDDEAQIEQILRSLPAEEREAMRDLPGWQATNERLQDNLSGTDLNVTNALIIGNDARADAYKLRDQIDEARRTGNHDALHTALAGMDPARREQIIQEFHHVRNGVEATATDVEPIDQAEATAEMVGYVTRDIEVVQHGGGHHGPHTRTMSIDGANEDLAVALIQEGNDSMAADVARFEVERTRRGGPKESNMETALMMSSATQEALRDPNHPNHAAAVQEQRERSAAFEAAWQEEYGQAEGAPSSVSDALDQTYSGHDNGELEVEAHQMMLEDGTNSARVVAAVTELSIDGAGTSEERMDRMWKGLTPGEADEATAIWEREHGNGESLEDRLFGGTFSEMSGDEELQMRRNMLGDEKYFEGEYADRALQLADLEYEWTAGDGGGVSGDDETENLRIHHTALHTLLDGISEREGTSSAFDAETGAFLGTPEEYERYKELCAFVGISAAHFRERQDQLASYVTTAIAVVGAVVAVVLTGGAAGPLVAAAFAAGTGLASMGANYAMKGNRYGWEQAAVDLGMTAVSAATAGAGAYLNGLNKGADGVARGIFNSSTAAGRLGGQTTVAAGSGFISGAAGTAMDDSNWEEGGKGAGGLFYSGFKGAGMGAASTYVGGRVSGSSWGQRMGEADDYFLRGAGSATSNMAGAAVSETLGMSMDASTGRYKGEFSDAVLSVGGNTLKSGGQAFLEGAGEVFHSRHVAPPAPTVPAPSSSSSESEESSTPTPQPGSEEGTTRPTGGDEGAEESSTPAPGSTEAEVVARTQADPEVQDAVARVADAEENASSTLQTSDETEAANATALNDHIADNSEQADDGTITTSVSRDEAQSDIDGMESRVLANDQDAFDEAQSAHTDAAATIESAEARHRAEIDAEASEGPGPSRAADVDADEDVATTPRPQDADIDEDNDTAASRTTAPENEEGSSDLAAEGGEALNMTADEVDQMSSLSGDDMEEFARRTRQGEDARMVLADLASGKPTSSADSDGAGSGTRTLNEDELTDEMVRLNRTGQLDDADVDYILDGANEQEMTQRLEERRNAKLSEHDDNGFYSDTLAEAQATADPDARAGMVDDIIAEFDLPGQGQAVAALRALDGNPDAQIELAHHMSVMRGLGGRDPSSLSDAEIISLCHAHHALINEFQAGVTELRKVIPMSTVEQLVSMQDYKGNATNSQTMGGSVADARNTEGLTPQEMISALGLDYDDRSYIQPSGVGDGTYTAKDTVFIVHSQTTEQMTGAAVPLAEDIRTRMAALADQDPIVANMVERSVTQNPNGEDDPFTGFGFTAPGTRLGADAPQTMNQELKVDYKEMTPVTIPPGSEIRQVLPDGQHIVVATLVQDGATGARHWQLNPDAPAELTSQLAPMSEAGRGRASGVVQNPT